MNLKDLTPWRSRSSGMEHPLTAMHREMDRMFANVFDTDRLPAVFSGTSASIDVDVSETDDAITVKADLPGLDEKDIDVSLDGDVLTIRAERRAEHEKTDEKTRIHTVERAYGAFARRIVLPAAADDAKAEANFARGVLEITIPKKPATETAGRKIAVKAR